MKRDDLIFDIIEKEHQRQLKGIELIASENFVSDQVMQTMGSCLTNKYAEGYPGKRYYGGCEVVDQSEQIAIDRLKQILINQLNSLQGAGINAVIFQVRPEADALYASQYEPWSRFLTGVQGKAPEPYWDPMQFMIEECHKRSMEFHAWINPYRVKTSLKNELSPIHIL